MMNEMEIIDCTLVFLMNRTKFMRGNLKLGGKVEIQND